MDSDGTKAFMIAEQILAKTKYPAPFTHSNLEIVAEGMISFINQVNDEGFSHKVCKLSIGGSDNILFKYVDPIELLVMASVIRYQLDLYTVSSEIKEKRMRYIVSEITDNIIQMEKM